MEVTIRTDWAMGHRLPNHDGKCRNLHGHTYTAEVTVEGPITTNPGSPEQGMVVDFGHIKHMVKKLLADYDHRFLLCDADPLLEVLRTLPGVVVVPYVPTAENISASLRQQVQMAVSERYDLQVTRLRLSESPDSWAEARI